MDAQSSQLHNFQILIQRLLHRERAIDPASIRQIVDDHRQWSIPLLLSSIAASLESHQKFAEAIALHEAVERITAEKEFGGLGISHALNESSVIAGSDYANAAFIVEALLLSLNSETYSQDFLTTSLTPCYGTKPMTLTQKIFAQHLVGTAQSTNELEAGAVVRVGLDWVLSSELSWQVCMG